MDVFDKLRSEFNYHVSFREKRRGVLQILAPLFHEDGDMVEVYLDLPKSSGQPMRLSDHGMTLMRLSYSYDVETPARRKVLERILSENGVSESHGRFFVDTTPEQLYPDLLQFAQTVAKVSNMQVFKREVIQSLFYENLSEVVQSKLSAYYPQQHYLPIPERDDLEVDWRFALPSRDIFLYGVREASKARLAALTCLEYQRANIPFRSVIVHEDFENGLSKKDQTRITNIADKQFTTLADFSAEAVKYFARETRAAPIQ